jgi:hypothetical protein
MPERKHRRASVLLTSTVADEHTLVVAPHAVAAWCRVARFRRRATSSEAFGTLARSGPSRTLRDPGLGDTQSLYSRNPPQYCRAHHRSTRQTTSATDAINTP